MIEYLTQTGIFGILWTIVFIIFIYSLIGFIKRNGIVQTLFTIAPIIIILLIANFIGNEVALENSIDKVAANFMKDMWFIMGHLLISSILIFKDRNCLEFWKDEEQINTEEENDN